MDLPIIIIGIIFFIVGTLGAIFAGHLQRWGTEYKFENNLNYWSPDENKINSNLTKEEYRKTWSKGKGFRHVFWLVGIIGMRIMGVGLALTGLFALLEGIFHL